MKRTPLQRTVGLARGPLNLPQKAPLARAAMRRQPAQQPRQPAKTGDWSQDTRDAVSSRSQGRCEVCSQPATDLHHRKRRREGDHRPVNALHLCRRCHGDVHANPTGSRDAGWIVSAWSRPDSTPVLVLGRWVLLTADGGYRTDQRGWPA